MRGKGDQFSKKSKIGTGLDENAPFFLPLTISSSRNGFSGGSPNYGGHDMSVWTPPNPSRYIHWPHEYIPMFRAVVQPEGIITLYLRNNCSVDIAPNQTVRIVNENQNIYMALSGCANQMALLHPMGRMLQYLTKVEIQVQDKFNTAKNAKMWQKGVSFTDANCSTVYLVDEAGARSTHDVFYDLYSVMITDTVFFKSFFHSYPPDTTNIDIIIRESTIMLDKAEYWRTEDNLDCWKINDITIKQTMDGLVSVERVVERGNEKQQFLMRTSPNNGKARFESSFMYATASVGNEPHIFVRSKDRRLHYNGEAFIVRNAGHSAGYDEANQFRLW